MYLLFYYVVPYFQEKNKGDKQGDKQGDKSLFGKKTRLHKII